MTKIRAAITAVEGYVPEYILTNDELSTMMDTSDEWIMTRIGIKERRILKGTDKGTSDMAAIAVQNLLDKKGLKPSDIDGVICCTVTPDMAFPATASIVSDKCGIHDSLSFDMNVGCSGFIYGLKTASLYIESGFCKRILLIGAEKMSSIVDYEDRATAPIFGDGAAVVMLEPTTEEAGVMDVILRSDGVGRTHLHMKAGGSLRPASIETIQERQHYIYQEGQAVFKWAVSKMADVSVEIMERNGLSADDIKYLLPHQANLRIIDAVGKRMGLDPEKVLINITKYANTTSATIPLLMWENQGLLKKGDNLILSAFGAGFSWGAIWLKWAI